MSGVKRNILAEIVSDGKVSIKEVQAKFSPDAMRAEKGQSIHTPAAKSADAGEYLGKNGRARNDK